LTLSNASAVRAYYFTPAQFAISNIALHRIKISRFSELNDPFELLAVDLADKNQRMAFSKMKARINTENGLICFSRKWENPLLWGHYAERHTGIALGFDIPSELLKPVIYDRKPMKIDINQEAGKLELFEETIGRLILTKFYDWKYEEELRFFVKLDHETVESGMYFYPFDTKLILREVILGPRCELPITKIRELTDSLAPSVSVISSRIAFSSFRVIKNRLRT
jgi:Protein of unknown function (DUF2971)